MVPFDSFFNEILLCNLTLDKMPFEFLSLICSVNCFNNLRNKIIKYINIHTRIHFLWTCSNFNGVSWHFHHCYMMPWYLKWWKSRVRSRQDFQSASSRLPFWWKISTPLPFDPGLSVLTTKNAPPQRKNFLKNRAMHPIETFVTP